MSYRIYVDDNLIYSPSATQRDYSITDGSIVYELNKAPTLTYTMPITNPMYDEYVTMRSIVKVYDDNDLIFRGRILNSNEDFYRNKTITCEGDLAFFNDSRVLPYEYEGTVRNLVAHYLSDHNSQVDAFKQFKLGDVTVTDLNDYVVRSNIEYTNCLEEMSNKLIDELGGYLSTETTLEEEEVEGEIQQIEHNYLHFTEESGGINSQVLSFGSNIIDLEQFIDGDDICTVLIPLGARINDSDTILTIASVNDGSIFLENQDAIDLYGRIVQTYQWDDVEEASNLKTKGISKLNELSKACMTITLNALDLSLIDVDEQALKLGEYNRVYSRPHNIDDYFQLSRSTIDLLRPSNNTYTFGFIALKLTDKVTNVTTKQRQTIIEEEEEEE